MSKRKMSSGAVGDEPSEEQAFLDLFPHIVSSVVTGPKFSNVPEIAARIKELLEYNSYGGNKTRGLMTVHAYKMLEHRERIKEESMRTARVLGWCVELFQTSLVILDDMVDNSSTRRGKPCWYRRPDAGYLTINDSFVLLTIVFDLLRDNLCEKDCYSEILYIFKEALRHLCIGQYPTLSHSKDYNQFTMDHFKKYSDYKRTYYTFKLPLYTSLLLAGKSYKDVLNSTTEDILADMGIIISMQNDYIDCFGDEIEFGKAGNDIQEGKCSWVAVLALQRFNAAQRAEFESNYGSADDIRVQRVKRLYQDVQLSAACLEAMKAAYNDIIRRIESLPSNGTFPATLLRDLFEMVYQMKVE